MNVIPETCHHAH